MNRCMICNELINEENDSKEHIIPASIGGRRTVNGFICRTCNNATGESWDSELAKQLEPYTVYLGIKRQKKKLASHIFNTVSGQELKVLSDGRMYETKPKIVIDKGTKEVKLSISARNKKELEKILTGISKKYPKIDYEKAMKSYFETRKYPENGLIFNNSFGGKFSGKSLIKSTMALIHNSGKEISICKEALDYLLNDSEPCFGYYYDSDLVENRPEGMPLNCVYVLGSRKNNNLIAYIEYYGILRIVCCLSNEYYGEEFNNIYAIDPITGKELNLKINLDFTHKEIQKIYNNEFCSDEQMRSTFIPIMNSAYKRSLLNESDRIVEKSVRDWCKENNISEENELTEEQAISLSSKIANDMLPLIMKNIKVKGWN